MSFVGPRPMITMHLPSDESVREKRFSVRPGITGLAQINGRTNITFKQRFEYDVEYVSHVNVFTDIKIFFITVWKTIMSIFKRSKKQRSQYSIDILEGTVEFDRLKALEEESSKVEA